MGAGAIAWFKFDADVALTRLSAWFAALLLVMLAAGIRRMIVRRAALAGLLCVAGMSAAQVETWRAGTVILDSAVTTTLSGRVERREGDDNGRWRYIVAVTETNSPRVKRAPARVSLVARAGEPLAVGAWLTGRVRLIPPAGPALPGLNDFAFSAYFDGVGANGFFYGAPSSALPPQETRTLATRDKAVEWLYGLRSGIGDRIRSILPADTGAFAASLVTDERRAISPETTEALRQSGLAHIVAISGLNMALSAGIFFVGLRSVLGLFPAFAQAYPAKKIAASGALLALTAYYLISGFSVSAERAFIMMAIMLVAVLFDRPSISLRNIALSALLIILTSPSKVLGPGFQMSFAATLALVAGYAIWAKRPYCDGFPLKHPVIRAVFSVVRFFGGVALTSVIGGFATALFSIEHFHRLSAYGLPANLMAMPVISFVVMPMGMLAMLLTPLGLDVLPWKAAGLGLDVVIAIAKMVSGWGGTVDMGRLPQWYFLAAVLGFLLLTLLLTPLRYLGAVVVAVSTVPLMLLPSAPLADLVVSEDGTLVAVVTGKALATNRERPQDFIFSQWQRALALERHQPPQYLGNRALVVPKKKDGERLMLTPQQRQQARGMMRRAVDLPEGGFVCLKAAWCVALLDSGYVVATLENAAYLGPACDAADIVITPVRLRPGECRSGSMLLTGETLRRSGALEIRIGDQGTPLVTAAHGKLGRPWMRHRAYDWRSGRFADIELPISDSAE